MNVICKTCTDTESFPMFPDFLNAHGAVSRVRASLVFIVKLLKRYLV